MIKVLRKIYELGAEHRAKINLSLVLQFLDSSLAFVPVGVALMFFQGYLEGTLTSQSPLIFFGILVLGIVVRIFTRYNMDKIQYSTVFQIFAKERIAIADHLKMVNMGYFSEDNIGKVTTVLTNTITFIEENGTNSATAVLSSSATVLAVFCMLCYLNPITAGIYAGICVVVFLILLALNKKATDFAVDYNKASEVLSSSIIEYVRNIAVVKTFHLVGKHKRSVEAISNQRKTDIAGEMVNIPYICGEMIVTALGSFAMLYYILGQTEIVPLYEVITISIFSLYAFHSLNVIALKVTLFNIAADGIDLMENLHNLEALSSKGNKKPDKYDITFENVRFGYDENQVLKGIDFHLEEHSMTALVGLSGSGKSTLVNLIPRFYDVTSGKILVGGVDIQEMSPKTLYDSIAMVFQDVYLFKDTIYNNIAFGNDQATTEMVVEACKKARCYDFIMEKPEGFETMVGEAGLSLSGGERQRISIARAILKDAPIILLDEATASVDPDNEGEIQEAINELVKDKTMLVIAHKLSCVENASKILVMGQGVIAEEGTHTDLLQSKGFYANLWDKRASSKSWKISKV